MQLRQRPDPDSTEENTDNSPDIETDLTDGEFTPKPPHQQRDILHRLYHEERLTQAEIADELNVTQPTVSYWFRKLDIPTRKGYGSFVIPHTENVDYPRILIHDDGERRPVGHHRLLAVASGADPADVFGENGEVHHRLPMAVALNLTSNLQAVTKAEHAAIDHPDAVSLDEIDWEQSGVPLDAIEDLNGSRLSLADDDEDDVEDAPLPHA